MLLDFSGSTAKALASVPSKEPHIWPESPKHVASHSARELRCCELGRRSEQRQEKEFETAEKVAFCPKHSDAHFVGVMSTKSPTAISNSEAGTHPSERTPSAPSNKVPRAVPMVGTAICSGVF